MKRSARTVASLAFGISVGVASLVGPAAGADPVTHRQTFDLAIGYGCSFPAGPGPATVRVTATAPVKARVGETIQVTDASLTVGMAPSVVAELGAVTVGATANLTVDGGAEPAGWIGSAPEVPVPAEEDLVLTVPVQAPEMTVAKSGDLILTAAGLEISLAPKLGDGTPTEPPTVPLSCTPAQEQDTALGTISVTGGSTPAPAPGDEPVDPEPPGFNQGLINPGEVPADCRVVPQPPAPRPGQPFCAYLTGFANVAKLNASVLQPHGILNIGPTGFQLNCKPGRLACQQANVEPGLDGKPQLPPAPASFLPFGFVPTTGTMQLTQVEGFGYADAVFTVAGPRTGTVVVTNKMMARVFDVAVNGVPLDVGDNCQTSVPIEVVFTANYPTYSITEGGVIAGVVTIPPFSGCGVTEDLDPVVSGMVSGPGNYVKLTQGNLCEILRPDLVRCPPNRPEPQR